jgi:hypothetical protein
MDSTITKFLREHYVDNTCTYHTHVSLIQPKGKYAFNYEAFEQFMSIYSTSIAQNPDIIVGIAEKPDQYLAVLADLDLKVVDVDRFDTGLYTIEHVRQVIKIYQFILRDLVENCTDKYLTCVLLEKPMYRITRNDITYYKNGFHLHFPYLFLSKDAQEAHLIPRVQELMRFWGISR